MVIIFLSFSQGRWGERGQAAGAYEELSNQFSMAQKIDIAAAFHPLSLGLLLSVFTFN